MNEGTKTKLAEVEAALPPPATTVDLVADAWERVRIAARASGRARRALNGERVGRELDQRLAAHQVAVLALNTAIDLMLDAETREGAPR